MDDEPGAWLPLAEAAGRLGLTVDALRHRVRKSELSSRRGNDGRVLVQVPGERSASGRRAVVGVTGIEPERLVKERRHGRQPALAYERADEFLGGGGRRSSYPQTKRLGGCLKQIF